MSDFEASDDYPAIVIDNGSSRVCAGFAGDDAPQCIISNVVGRPRFNTGGKKLYVGNEAQSKRELLSLTYPVEHGIVTNWEDMEKVWNHMFFTELQVSPEQHPVLISEPPLNPNGSREKMAQIMFETYGTPALFLAFQPMLHLLATGLHHGFMISVGDSVTHVVPIYETKVLFQAIRRLDFGGRDLTRYLQQLLYRRGHCFTTSAELEVVREMKEKMCFVAEDGDVRQKFLGSRSTSYRLPDGSSLKLGQECYEVPELLFKPDGIFHTGPSLAEMIVDSLNDCEIDARESMYYIMSLSGSTTYFPGFENRLKRDVMSVSGQRGRCVKVWARAERKYHSWIGGSILASLSTFQSAWITRQEYAEYGPYSVIMRCYGE